MFVPGDAYLVLHQGNSDVADLQKILDHRGVVWNCLTGALADGGVARAHAVSGGTTKSKAAYQDFFALWKDADPDIPVLKEAKAE